MRITDIGNRFRKTRVIPAQAGIQRRSSKDTGVPAPDSSIRGPAFRGNDLIKNSASRTFLRLDSGFEGDVSPR